MNKIYDLIVTSNLYKSNIKVTAPDLSSASKTQSKVKRVNKYSWFQLNGGFGPR